MKIKIEQTVEIKGHDLDVLRVYFEDVKDEGENFRDWYKSTFIACGHQFMDEKICDYGRVETYGVDDPDRFAKDEDGNTIAVARVGELKPEQDVYK